MAVIFQFPLWAAGTANLAWDASPDASVTGYKVYYGAASRNYTNSISVGNALTTAVSGLADGTTYYFAATAYDASGAESDFSNEAVFTTAAGTVNQPPTLNALTGVTVNEDAGAQSVSLSGISSGSAAESQTLAVTATSSNPALIPNPTVSYTSPGATGSLSFTPVANANGTATITVTVNDSQAANNTITRTFVVTVGPVNDVPTLNALANLTINEDATAQSVSLSGIGTGAANETQTLTITATSSNPTLIPNPTVSYASPSATGSLSFTPVANASGSATITVTVNDGQAANNTLSRSFTVTVSPVNDAPTLTAIGNVSIAENASVQTVNVSGISSGASDEAQTLTLTATSSNPAMIPNPTVNYTSPNATGSLTFTPVTDVNGSATITVTLNDGQAANNTIVRTFTVNVSAVNNPPTLAALNNLTINEDATAQSVSLSGIGTGAANETQTLAITATSSNPTLIPNPAVTYTSPNATGSLGFTPVANASGSATITVTVNDGQAANNTLTRSFTVTVSPVNDAPTLATIGNVSIAENAGIQTVNVSGISSGASDEAQTLTLTATSSNPGLIPNPTVNFVSPNPTGSLTFTPVADVNGSATITVTLNDGQAANNTIVRTFTVNVSAVNNPPTLAALNNLTINEDATVQSVSLSGIGTGAANETQTLTVTATSSNPTLIPNSAVTYTSPNATGSLSFTPVANASGSATITVTVNDGQAVNNTLTRSFTVTVSPVNDAPTLAAIGNVSIAESAGVQTVSLSGISTGAGTETDTLTVTATSSNPALIPNPTVNYASPSAAGSLSFTPVANANGLATITVTVNDGQAANNTVTRTFTVTVADVNNPPTLNALNNLTINEDAGAQSVGLSGIGTGAANETQTLTITATSSNPTLIPNPAVNYASPGATGSLAFTPVANANGSATITVTVNDGQAANNTITRTFVVTVSAVNNAPTLTALGNLTVNEDAGAQSVSLSGIGTGAANETQTLTVTATSSNPTLIPNPAVTYSSPSATGNLNFTPVANASGSATITVTVNDGQAANNTVTRTFTVAVSPVNDAPTLSAISNLTLSESAGLQTINLAGIATGASDETDPLTVTATSSNPTLIPNPTVNYTSPNATGSLNFTPAAGANGSATITVTVNDGQAQNNTVTRTFVVGVNVVNDPPTLGPIANVTLNEDGGLQTVNVSGITSGATNENQTLTVSATSSNPALIPNPTVNYTSPNANGTLAFTPVANGSGSATITVTIDDGQAANNTASRMFVVTVNPVNDAPTLGALNNLTLNEDPGPQTVNLTGIGTGASNETQTLTITATSSNPSLIAGGTVTYTSPNATGTLVFTPVANTSGAATITITVNDGQAANNTVTRSFTVTVNDVNDAPTLNAIGNISLNQDSAQVTANLSGITTGATNETQTLTVTASSSNPSLIPTPTISYTSPSATGTVTFTPATGQSGSATITVTVNDGQAQNNTFARTFTVSVNDVNDPPTLDAVSDLSINKNDPAQTVSLSGITTGAANESQTLTVSAVSSNPGLIPTPVISYINPNTTATLVFTPVANASGVARITVTVNDGQTVSNTVSRSFAVSVIDNAPAIVSTNAAATPTNEVAALPTSGSATYNGLFSEESGVKLPSSGFFTVKVTPKGSYSGKLQNAGKSYSFRGTLDGQGQISSTINRDKGSTLALQMRLGAGAEADQIFGTVSDGTWTAKLDGDRAVYSKKSNPSPNAGKYTLALPSPTGDPTMPVGDGYGTVTVDAGGVARFAGSLPDGSKVSQSVALSKNGTWPLFGSFGGGKGFYATSGGANSLLLSWMNFANQPTDDLNGSVVWIKQADAKAKSNVAFNGEIKAFGSVFDGGSLVSSSNAVVTFSGGAFGAGLSQSVPTGGKSGGSDKLSLKFSTAKGTFSGKVTDPKSGKPVPFSGVVVQKRNLGAGFVLEDGGSSRVALKP